MSGLVVDVNDSGDVLFTDGWPEGARARTFQTLTISGLRAVSPVTLLETGHELVFTVAEDSQERDGAMAIRIQPPMIESGQYRNITKRPTSGAAVSLDA